MGSLEEIYWNMVKKQWKVGAHYALMSYLCVLIYILLFVKEINYL